MAHILRCCVSGVGWPLTWEPPYVAGAALEKPKRQKAKKPKSQKKKKGKLGSPRMSAKVVYVWINIRGVFFFLISLKDILIPERCYWSPGSCSLSQRMNSENTQAASKQVFITEKQIASRTARRGEKNSLLYCLIGVFIP